MATTNEPGARAYDDLKRRTAAGVEDLGDRERAEEMSSDMGQHAENVAEAVRTAGESLRGKEDWLADAAESLARSLERLSASAREKGLDGIKRDVEQLARERPVVFMGTALAVGLALGRVLRSSPPADRADPYSQSDAPESDAREATEEGSEQIGPGAGWPSAPEAPATPAGPGGTGGTR